MSGAIPVAYHPALETVEPDEAETTQALIDTMTRIQDVTFKDYGHAVRGVHAKSHGLLQGEMRVLDDLPTPLAQGVFAQPGRYEVILRISTTPGDILDDAVFAPRGLALKILGVSGEQLSGAGGTQDFVMANAPAFSAPDPRAFLGNLKLLAKTTDVAQGLKKVASAVFRGTEALLEKAGGKSATLVNLGGQPLTHPLGESFYTQVPMRYGQYVAKLRVSPVSSNLIALSGTKIHLSGRPNALRDDVSMFFASQGGEWEVAIQLYTDPDYMPIEDAAVPWPEELSPYLPVARITVPPQPAWSDARAAVVDDQLAFSPWHGLVDHRPLGGVMRVRKAVYEGSAAFRATHNGCPMHEPRAPLGSLPA